MKRGLSLVALTVSLVAGGLALAQEKKEPQHARISIYRIAPGKHLEFLKWLAAQEEAAKEAGVPATQVYAHRDGAAWDYLAIGPETTP